MSNQWHVIDVEKYFRESLQEYDVEVGTEYNQDLDQPVLTVSVLTEDKPLDFYSFNEILKTTDTKIHQISSFDNHVEFCIIQNF